MGTRYSALVMERCNDTRTLQLRRKHSPCLDQAHVVEYTPII